MSILQSMTGLMGARITDQVIASDLLAAGKLGCQSLTMSTLEAATPELRRFLQECLNECLMEHERVSVLSRERGWYQPYASPEEQLRLELRLSEPAAEEPARNG